MEKAPAVIIWLRWRGLRERFSGHEVTCSWQGARFDVRTGQVVGPPAQQAVAGYGVRVTESDVEVEM